MADYDFLKELSDPHGKIIKSAVGLKKNELSLPKEPIINKAGAGEVTLTALEDFAAFLKEGFGINAKLAETSNAFMSFSVEQSAFSLPEAEKETAIAFETKINDKIRIVGANDRSVAQAIYYLEFCLKERGLAALKKGAEKRSMPFTPRMVHSAYGLDEFPDAYLSILAHYGYNAILIFVKGVNRTELGELDFNELISRAKKFGIDVYAYCDIVNFLNPRAENAEKVYDELYGSLFKACPGLKGMVFVGESVEFLSDDEHVVKHRYNEYPKEGIPENKPSPGWWPCKDYSEWISLVRDSIRRYKKDADVVFWTYNWGWAPEKDRLALIEKLPTDITLLVTFEMFERYEIMGVEERVSDYSLTRPTAGSYFLSEAEAAKKRGIKLYSMVNTAGRTWDFGTVPYLPMPYAWIERYKSIREANEKYGLCGLMEGHHYGMYPSFIARLCYLSYYSADYGKNLDRALKAEYGVCSAELKRGLKLWSEAIKYLPPTIEEQYGPLRVGTVYPLCLIKGVWPPENPGAHFGNRIWSPLYGQFENGLCLGFGDNGTPYCVREKAEMKMLDKTSELMERGVSEMEKVTGGDVSRLINLGKYINCCVKTVRNVKEFYRYKMILRIGCDKNKMQACVKGIKQVAAREKKNALESIAYLENDSSLGFEPSMLYAASKERVEWKVAQIDYMLDNELAFYEV